MKKEMRRKEKEMTKKETLEVLANAEYGVLSTISEDNTPYGTPMNFVYLDGTIYFHCALEGHRLENIKRNHNVCFSVVDSVKLMPDKFNTQYRSAAVFGTIQVVHDTEEKRKGIIAIMEKLSSDYHDAGIEYINSAFDKLCVLKLEISHMTGKATRG